MNIDMRRWVKGALACLLLGVIAATWVGQTRAAEPKSPISVGMVALLAAPEKYNGKTIRTWGFLNLRPDDDAIFLHEEDLRVPLLKNSFRLELTPAQRRELQPLALTYVVVEGTLKSQGAAGPQPESGTITTIKMVNGWKPFVPFKEKK